MDRKDIEKIEVSIFEKKLQGLAHSGKLEASMNRLTEQTYSELVPAALSETELKSIYQTVKKASHEKALVDAKIYLTASLAFGRLLHFLRDKSGLTQIDIARLLRRDKSYVESLENCKIDPLKMPISDLADIVELFRINVSELVRAVKETATLSYAKASNVNAMARASIKAGTKQRGESISHAIDSVLLAIAKKEGASDHNKTDIDDSFLNELRKELLKRGCSDLLV